MSSNLNQMSSTGDFSSPDPKPKIAISYFSTLLLKCPFNFQEREKKIDRWREWQKCGGDKEQTISSSC